MNENDLNEDNAARSALPENRPEYEGVVREVQSWAREGEAPPRLDTARLRAEVAAAYSSRSGHPRSVWLGAGWLLTAASLCILALSFSEFRVDFGSFSFQMGSGVPEGEYESLRRELADIQRRLDLNRSEYSAAIETLSNRTIALENDFQATAAKLIRAQEAESATRYNEISSILSMTSRSE